MLRVSKTLLCASAARVVLAVRQNVKVDKTGTLVNVVEKIGALIQAQDTNAADSKAIDNIRMLAAGTPQVDEELADSLRNVITQIELTVDGKIQQAFTDTQTAVTLAISHLDTETEKLMTDKVEADTLDSAWIACVEDEQSALVAVENAKTEAEAAYAATIVPCQQQEDRRMFTSDPNQGITAEAKPLAFDCDLDIEGNCPSNQMQYNQMVKGIVNKLNTDATTAIASWTEAKVACVEATRIKDLKVGVHTTAVSTWSSQKASCQQPFEDRKTEMCKFGGAFQNKCAKVDAYNDLITKVDGDNSDHSESDRQLEWQTTHVTKCMLQKVILKIALDTQSLAACEDEVTYDVDVGTLNRKKEEFDSFTTPAKFSCSEETINFNGESWVRPTVSQSEYLMTLGFLSTEVAGDEATEVAGDASSLYVKFDFFPKVDAAVGSNAFDFC